MDTKLEDEGRDDYKLYRAVRDDTPVCDSCAVSVSKTQSMMATKLSPSEKRVRNGVCAFLIVIPAITSHVNSSPEPS